MMDETTIVENRSEIVFLYDVVDANPNGNPLSEENRPRIDPQTRKAIVTDVRLKRYLRDQLEADGHGVYIRNVNQDGEQYTRERLLEDRLKSIDLDEYDPDDDDDLVRLRRKVFDTFLNSSVDVRYFGATLSVDAGEYSKALPDHFTGPVQFSPAKSMNKIRENESYESLSSVIATQEGKKKGGFDLADHRIQYGLFRFHGLVDEHAAEDTKLSKADIERLDTLCWRALKNQTITRSKKGHEPQLYLRIEYNTDSYHIGRLDRGFQIDRKAEQTKPDTEIQNIRGVTISIDDFVNTIKQNSQRISTVHVMVNDSLIMSHQGKSGGKEVLCTALETALDEEAVHEIDVYEEYADTLPNSNE